MKRINTHTKGNRLKLEAIKDYESNGYIVSNSERTGKFIKQKDIFGLFDFIAMKEYDIRFVQVTSNKPHSHKKYLDFSIKYPPMINVHYVQGVHHDRKGWVWYTYNRGEKFIEDNRKQKTNKVELNEREKVKRIKR